MIPFLILPDLMVRTPRYTWQTFDLNELRNYLKDPGFIQAIRLASHELYQQLKKKDLEWEKMGEKERYTLAKYFNRMCRRPVPFGCFSSFGMCSAQKEEILHTCAAGLPAYTLPRPLPPETLLYPNPSLYRAGNHYRYTFTERKENAAFAFRLDAIDAVRFNRDLIGLFKNGPVKAGELSLWIDQRSPCGKEEADDYVFFLTDEQVLYTKDWGTVIDPGKNTVQPNAPVYAALERPMPANPAPDLAKLQQLIQILRKLVPAKTNPDLDTFIKTFKQRFDRQRVPLLVALDPDLGIDYPQQTTPQKYPQLEWQAIHRLLIQNWNSTHIRLRAKDIENLPEPTLPMPPSLPVLFRQTTEGPVIDLAAGSSALQLAGRFAYFSDAVKNYCHFSASEEQLANPEVAFADIHLIADNHVDNINRRPRLYPYEIPLNICGDASAEHQLQPSDLLLSIQGSELILESKRVGKRIIPRLASAYNYRRSNLAVYRLLCDLQFQGLQANIQFDPESIFPGLDHYPRISVDELIISPQKWHTEMKDVDLSQLPRYISVGANDQQLIFDLDIQAEREMFLKTKGRVMIQEYFPPAGTRVQQFSACVLNPERVYAPLLPAPNLSKLKRSFAPGSDWLYLKFYCSPPTVDEFLATVVAPVIRREESNIRQWFFIRYNDQGGHHLRLRIRAKSGDTGPILIALNQKLKASGLQHRVREVQGDTYHREVERYGAAYMDDIETLFKEGSRMVVELLAEAKGKILPEESFSWAIRFAREVIDCFELQEDFAKSIAEAFIEEFGGQKALRVELDQQYRNQKEQVANAYSTQGPETNNFRKAVMQVAHTTRHKLQKIREALAADLIHMQLNRIFREDARKQEMLTYHCLYKHLIRLRKTT